MGAPTVVQATYADEGSSSASSLATSAFGSSQASGNANFVFVVLVGPYPSSPPTVTGVTDSNGNTYTQVGSAYSPDYSSSYNVWQYTFRCSSIVAGSGNVVTAHFSASEAYCAVIAVEINGYSSVDLEAFNYGNSASPTCSITTTGSNELILAFVEMGSSDYTGAGSGWTNILTTSPQKFALNYLTTTSAGSYTTNPTISASYYWQIVLIALNGVAGTPPTVTAQAATSVGQTTATLNGTITSLGSGNATIEGFNWGLTTSYGNVASSSGSFGTGAFSQNLTGLSPGTTYHFQAFATNSAGTGDSSDNTFTTLPATITKEVIFTNAVQLGSDGGSGTLANAFGGNSWVKWVAINASGGWTGLDIGAATPISRIRFHPDPGDEDYSIGAQFQANVSDSTFTSGNVTLGTISSRPITGTLLNEIILTPGTSYRYLRILSGTGGYGTVGCDFYGQWVSGCNAMCATPYVVSPTSRILALPTVITLGCLTADAVLYYTLDGSAPTSGSTKYTGPFVISTDCTLNVIGISPNVSNSRIMTAQFVVSNSIYAGNLQYDSRSSSGTDSNLSYSPSPYQMWAVSYHIFFDPVGKQWWLYGDNRDAPGTDVATGLIGTNIFSSPDLVNWTYVGLMGAPSAGNAKVYAGLTTRPRVVYNALNNNYVMWLHQYNSSAALLVFTATAPQGPWTLQHTYSTIQGLSADSDIGLFIDPSDGVTAYMVSSHGAGVTTLISLLTNDYQNVTATYLSLNDSSFFGRGQEAPNLFKRGNTYFLLGSGYNGWLSSMETYAYTTAANPLSGWINVGNFFANVSVPQTPSEVALGITPSYTNGYDSQVNQILQIPGRDDGSGKGCYIYIGDRMDYNGSSGNFQYWRPIILPISFPTATSLSVTWRGQWTLDATFPNVSGAPLAASGLMIAGLSATWTNNEPNPANIYLDSSSNVSFTSGLSSTALPAGSNSFTIVAQSGPYFRIRTVNANGSSVSNIFNAATGGGTLSFGNPAISLAITGAASPMSISFPFIGGGVILNVPNSSITLAVPVASKLLNIV